MGGCWRKRTLLRCAHIDPRELLRVGEKKGVVFVVNLGLDCGFIFAGLTAVAASRLGVDDRDRWLGGGLAALTQGAFAAVIDLVGTLASRRAHQRALAQLTSAR